MYTIIPQWREQRRFGDSYMFDDSCGIDYSGGVVWWRQGSSGRRGHEDMTRVAWRVWSGLRQTHQC
jgi:hypothetical protein